MPDLKFNQNNGWQWISVGSEHCIHQRHVSLGITPTAFFSTQTTLPEPTEKKALVSLEDFNRDRSKLYEYTTATGIACPQCGAELHDVNGIKLMSNPPQKEVCCRECQYNGYRVA